MLNLILIVVTPLLIGAIGLGVCEYWRWCCRMADEKAKEGVK